MTYLVDRNSPEWVAIKANMEDVIADTQRAMETEPEPMQLHRQQGMIQALRGIIKNVEPPASVDTSPPDSAGARRLY